MTSAASCNAVDEVFLVIALRHLGIEREILVLKAKGENFYAFLPGALSGLDHCKIHFSFHRSGRRHMVAESIDEGEWREDKWPRHGAEPETMREQTKTQLTPPARLRGAHLFGHCGIVFGQFHGLPPISTNHGERIVLDAEAAGFRDDFTIVRAYVIEPGREDAVPTEPFAGPRVVHFIRRTAPWLAVEVFQQAAAG